MENSDQKKEELKKQYAALEEEMREMEIENPGTLRRIIEGINNILIFKGSKN